MAKPAISPLDLVPYEYEPLPTPTSIRLLSILPKQLSDPKTTICGQSLVTCFLEIVDLKDAQEYSTLSYTWGNPRVGVDERYDATHKWPININGRIFYVNRNLHQALLYLQDSENKDKDLEMKREPYAKTHLIEAAEENRLNDVNYLLLKGASVHSQDMFGETALHYAAENGHLEVVKLLLHYNASKSIVDMQNRTPIHCCEQRKRGQWKEVQRILTETRSRNSRDLENPAGLCVIWIDAICINQNDVTERNIQVAMMAQIYRRALEVVVWLGPEDDETASESETVASLGTHTGWKHGICLKRQKIVENIFTRHTWFRRKWVVQEVALAKFIVVQSGSYSFNWNLLCTVKFVAENTRIPGIHQGCTPSRMLQNEDISGVEYSALILSLLRMSVNTEVRTATRSEMSRISETTGADRIGWDRLIREKNQAILTTTPSLSQLLIMTWGFDATDPRDKVYALLGMVNATEDLSSIAIDYHKSTEQVFLETGRLFIQAQYNGVSLFDDTGRSTQWSMGPLEGLTFVQPAHCARDHFEKKERPCSGAFWPELPTWVPRFDRKLTSMRFYDQCFNACGDTTYVSHTSDPKLLKIDAHFIDEITMVERPPRLVRQGLNNEYGGYCPYNVSSWLAMIIALAPTYFTGEHREDVLWRTLIANPVQKSPQQIDHNSEQQHSSRFAESFKHFVCHELSPRYATFPVDEDVFEILDILHETDQTSCLPARSQVERYDDEEEGGGEEGDYDKREVFQLTLAMYVRLRGLFITECGYLGNGFNTARPGDQVWLFAGARVPFVLRKVPDSDRFELIGEAYVHGLMHGEAVTKDIVDKFQAIEIQ